MSPRYSKETQRILQDFLQQLEASEKVDPFFLGELRSMAREGKLASAARIRQAMKILEAQGDDL